MSLLSFFPFPLFHATVMSCYVDIFIFENPFPILLWLTNDESGVILTLNIIQLACKGWGGGGSLHTSQVAHQAGAYPGFRAMKRL